MKKLLVALIFSGFFLSGCANIDIDVDDLPFSNWGKDKKKKKEETKDDTRNVDEFQLTPTERS